MSATKGLEPATHAAHERSDRAGPSPRLTRLVSPFFPDRRSRWKWRAARPPPWSLASRDAALAAELQEEFAAPNFRLYTNDDVLGVELAGAMKNVIAIAAGTCQGLGLGSNSLAALITRGLAEMSRLAVALGAKPETLSGLAGLGDLVLTCTGSLSRNRHVGIELGKGRSLAEIIVRHAWSCRGCGHGGRAVGAGWRT